jgi:transcriptional regulator NrdR family protein
MKCPKCKDKSEVLETRHVGDMIQRRRRCLSPRCQWRFITTEFVGRQRYSPMPGEDEEAQKARAIVSEFKSGKADEDVMRAMIATDLRRAKISRDARVDKRRDADTWYDSGFDQAPDRLTREELAHELGDDK